MHKGSFTLGLKSAGLGTETGKLGTVGLNLVATTEILNE